VDGGGSKTDPEIEPLTDPQPGSRKYEL
jgi:hypothetical protein